MRINYTATVDLLASVVAAQNTIDLKEYDYRVDIYHRSY